MIILCDTGSVLMLLRIAPEMFQDSRYECVTTPEVFAEIVQTQKFKDRYPWRVTLKNKIKCLPPSISKSAKAEEYFQTITALNNAGITDAKTERCIDLSWEDRRVLACALANGYLVSTTERALIVFARQEFSTVFKRPVSPLEIINMWLKKKLIKWDDEKQNICAEWQAMNERPQPRFAKEQFEKLTKRKYAGN